MRNPNARLVRDLYQSRSDDSGAVGAPHARPLGLTATLLALACYTGLLGLLFLFGQDLAEALLEIPIADPTALRQWGVALLILAAMAALLASDPLRYRPLLVVPIVGLLLDSAVLAYDLLTGASGLRQLGAPLAINLALLAGLTLGGRRTADG